MLKVEKTRFVNKIPRPTTTYFTISEIEAILYSMEYRIFDEGCAFIDVEWGESDKKSIGFYHWFLWWKRKVLEVDLFKNKRWRKSKGESKMHKQKQIM